MAASVTSVSSLSVALLFIHLFIIDASLLKDTLKYKPSLNLGQDSLHDLPVLDEPEEIDFPKSSDQRSRVPHAISYGWSKANCMEAAAKSPCQKCKCSDEECMLLTETCAETVCPLVEDVPVDAGLCCPTCPTYGDGKLEALEAECNKRALQRFREGKQLCPEVCVCIENGASPMCSVEPIRMCKNECQTKYGSDPCARCECGEGEGPCTLIMQMQSEPFCGEGVKPVEKEGVCGLTCPKAGE